MPFAQCIAVSDNISSAVASHVALRKATASESPFDDLSDQQMEVLFANQRDEKRKNC